MAFTRKQWPHLLVALAAPLLMAVDRPIELDRAAGPLIGKVMADVLKP